jgi:hypothetical protein
MFASVTTWAKLVREPGRRRPRRPQPPAPASAVRASQPNQGWRLDATIFGLLDGTRAPSPAAIDHFSRARRKSRSSLRLVASQLRSSGDASCANHAPNTRFGLMRSSSSRRTSCSFSPGTFHRRLCPHGIAIDTDLRCQQWQCPHAFKGLRCQVRPFNPPPRLISPAVFSILFGRGLALRRCRGGQATRTHPVSGRSKVKRWSRAPRTAIWAGVLFRPSPASPSTPGRSLRCGRP